MAKVAGSQPLQAWQKQGLQQATAAGNQQQFLTNHPGVQNRLNFLQQGNPQQQAHAQTLLSRGAPAAPAPQGSGATGANKPSGGGGGGAAPTATPPAAPAGTPPAQPAPTFSGALTGQYGQGQPFDLQSWYGDNPLETGAAAATQNLNKNLASIRNTYAGGGLGTSAQEALAEGTAAAQMNTQLGQYLSQLGQTSRAQDVQTALQAFLGAGQQQLQGQQNQIQANQGMGQLGQILTQLGMGEQGIPNANLIASILGLYTQQQGQGVIQQQQTTKGGFLGM
jgi:hypothetical protein